MIADDFEAIAKRLETIRQEEQKRLLEQDQQNSNETSEDDDASYMDLSDWF